ncbi:tRNA (adenosine(37)-N6)-threonylcarbamoyltransferase complex dimerization subunit type 1 TsaB [Desulfovibrio sp. JC022]|uniref:tRNA (adenosine(37)-N6)-threonylcarbamoyltransferase complex dimerization subunit type 1 TsaB n=1 Tax=Desulfovibrio sp. JC022 TaxID=2593642 RepID=UPI0013D191E9|nr:tRNA (adenosine(37)-N6)-threonylcarbamoyltransferase complex dimerization subunit type 1 TsaB [Desulfovibrio sp. JC022]NDV24611.1 tRNA (adenosine(37)-N6)-threonylcarbamoyltransferase complex dimerization subunit type 1 TsaB [Desulfovibrio sp. JC022]
MSVSIDKNEDLLLAINGAEETLQIVLARRSEDEESYSLLEAKRLVVPGRSVNFLIPSIRDSLKLFGYNAGEISRIAITAGPGSFTGLRLTFAAAAGLSAGSGCPVCAMEYLPILAKGAAIVSGLPVWAVTHSRRMQVYLQGFEPISENGKLTSFTPPLPVTIQEAAEVILSYRQEKAALSGSGLLKNKAFFDEFMAQHPQYTAMPERFNIPADKDMLDAAQQAEYSDEMPMPMYLRGSDAEENLEAITRKRGISLEAAREQLKDITPR